MRESGSRRSRVRGRPIACWPRRPNLPAIKSAARRHREDLESAIRLARLDVGELQGLAIPTQCQGCKSGQCKKPGRKPSNSKSEQKKDARGASSGPPPDKSGS